MEQEGQFRHIERVVKVVTNGENSSCEVAPDDIIRRSWSRCANHYGLDPADLRNPRIIPSNQLREHQGRIDEFLRVARAGMEQLYKQTASLGYVLLLSDNEGVTVDYIANSGTQYDLKAHGVYVGAEWKEDHAGTSGIGTVLVEKTPLICHQGDHFDAKHIGLSCTAAPIFDPQGQLLAVLNITAMMSPRSKESQFLALQLTAMQAKAIEDANFIRHYGNHWILLLSRAWPFAEVGGEIMIAFDDDGVVVGANTLARRDLSGIDSLGDWIIGRHLTQLFKCTMDDVWKAARGIIIDTSVMTIDSLNMFYLAVRLPRREKNLRIICSENQLPSDQSSHREPEAYPALDSLADNDITMNHTLQQAKRIVNRSINILIHGETGAGKEIFARALHKSSTRNPKPFIALNCAAIPESLIESELFGYTPGSFTGGRSKGMKGLIQQSDGGTLFLDEIGDMPLNLQTRLLRVLSESEVMPIGGERPIQVNLTVISASHRDLRTMISDGRFREDLYYRLCGTTLRLPPLREREDKMYIFNSLLKKESEYHGTVAVIVPDALDAMMKYQWPGNIRELRNALRYALAVSDDGKIRIHDLPHEITDGLFGNRSGPQGTTKSSDQATKSESYDTKGERLLALLRKNKWNISATATELEVSRVTVYRQMKRYKIVSPTETH